LNFKGKAKRLEDIDLPRIGMLLGVGEDEIHAVMDVESRGGFDKQGRPAMLFEPHVFWRLLKGDPAKQSKAVAAGVARPKWVRDYPPDSYPRLATAMAISPGLALMSASWGAFQIMGFNYALAGYRSVEAMVADFAEDEEAHLQAMATFVLRSGLDDELRNHDWRGFALGYNGKEYAKNGYDRKLEAAYRKWSKINDTPYDRKPKPTVVVGTKNDKGLWSAIAAALVMASILLAKFACSLPVIGGLIPSCGG